MTKTMKRKTYNLLEPGFWPKTALLWGLATGNIIALALVVGLAFWLTKSMSAVEWTCVVMLLLMAPISIYLIRDNTIVAKMRTPVEIIGGFVACVIAGFFIVPMAFEGLRQAVVENRKVSHVAGQMAHPTGKEAFFSLPGNVARHTNAGLAASFFSERRS